MPACIVAVLLILPSVAVAASCKADARVIGDCFPVHGRASMWNGNPTLRIWKIGSKRMLGVREAAPVPQNLKDEFDSFWTEVFGDFLVCPFTPSRPGRMQIVCVESAHHLVTRRRAPE